APRAVPARIRRSVTFCKVRDDFVTIIMKPGTQHSKRLEHVAMGERTEARASRARKHCREKPVASVGIHAPRPRRKRKLGHLGDELEDLLLRQDVIGRVPNGSDQIQVLWQPRSVPQQVREVDRWCPNRDFWDPTPKRMAEP